MQEDSDECPNMVEHALIPGPCFGGRACWIKPPHRRQQNNKRAIPQNNEATTQLNNHSPETKQRNDKTTIQQNNEATTQHN